MAMAAPRPETAMHDGLALVERELESVGRDAGYLLRDAIGYHLQTGGKRVRPRVALLAGQVTGGSFSPALVRFAAVTELVHAASLVHDDTLDEAATRRGIETVSARWGDHVAVLVGDYLFAHAAILTAGLGNLRLMGLLAETIQSLVQGELAQLSAAYRIEASAENYETRIAAKSASLFVLAAQGGAVLGGAGASEEAALRAYARDLGLAFQVADDVLDYTGSTAELGKPAGSDLSNGVVTLPALYYLETLPPDAPERHLIEEGGDMGQLVLAIRSSDGPSRALAYARLLARRSIAALSAFPESTEREALADLAETAVRRRS